MGKGSTCYILLIRNTLQRTTEKHSRKKKKKKNRKVSVPKRYTLYYKHSAHSLFRLSFNAKGTAE